LIYPSADIIDARVGSRYSLVVLAAKRAKQLKEGAPPLIETASTNPLTVALEEIAAGKVTIGEAAPIAETRVVEREKSAPSRISALVAQLSGEDTEVGAHIDIDDDAVA
jgi:DNA-directed RNA polymerase subunit omega